jgi:hypothetical protein
MNKVEDGNNPVSPCMSLFYSHFPECFIYTILFDNNTIPKTIKIYKKKRVPRVYFQIQTLSTFRFVIICYYFFYYYHSAVLNKRRIERELYLQWFSLLRSILFCYFSEQIIGHILFFFVFCFLSFILTKDITFQKGSLEIVRD